MSPEPRLDLTPTLEDALQGCSRQTWYHPVHEMIGADPTVWPPNVRKAFAELMLELVKRVGPIEILSRQFACVEWGGRIWCAVKVFYLRSREGQVSSVPSDVATGSSARSEFVAACSPSEDGR